MVVCPSCGGEDFEEVSGLYYCSECNQQSQEFRLEELDDEGAPSPHVGRSSPRQARKEPGEKRTEDKRCYHPNELFNIILVRQVDAIISLGASPELRGVVCELWMDYLVKLEAVSRVEDEERTPRIGAVNRWSDLRATEELLVPPSESQDRKRKQVRKALFGSGVRTRVTPRTSRRRKQQKNRCAAVRPPNLDSEFEDASETEDVAAQAEKLDASDDEWEDLRSSHAKEYLEREASRGANFHDRKVGRDSDVTVVTLQRLLCFLYLGILTIGDPILLTDILRWAQDGHLPYLHVMHLLPEDAKLWGQQWRAFVRLVLPTIDELALQAAHLAHFLNVRHQLQQPPVLPIVMRLVTDLNLPLEIVNVCAEVLAAHPAMEISWEAPPPRTPRSVPLFSPICELRAAALLLLALKLTFGLDGTREKKLSRAAEDVGARHPESNLFSWSSWERHCRARVLLLRSSCYMFEPDNPDDIRDIATLIRHPDSIPSDRSALAKALREGLQKSFRELHERELVWRGVPATSFPISSAVRFFLEETDVSPGLRSVLEESFLDKDVTYLTRAGDGVPSLGGWGKLCEDEPEFVSVVRDRCDQYWTVALRRVYDVRYATLVQRSLPKVFLWLLQFLATLTYCSPKELYRDLLRIEGHFIKRNRVVPRSEQERSLFSQEGSVFSE